MFCLNRSALDQMYLWNFCDWIKYPLGQFVLWTFYKRDLFASDFFITQQCNPLTTVPLHIMGENQYINVVCFNCVTPAFGILNSWQYSFLPTPSQQPISTVQNSRSLYFERWKRFQTITGQAAKTYKLMALPDLRTSSSSKYELYQSQRSDGFCVYL